MLYVKISRNSSIKERITDFYITLYYERLYGLTKRKYTKTQANQHIRNALMIMNQTYDESQLRKPTISRWKKDGWYEIYFKNWHFAVTVQYDLFGNCTAMVLDCCHDKDYHNDTMETKPFVMDNSNDQSHMVDWNEHRYKKIVEDVIRKYLKRNLL